MGEPISGHSREGETLCGKYLLGVRLGQGGMGQVYRARNLLVGRDVAIKVLRREHAENEILVGRFLREAQAANIVRHVNVVDVLDIGKDEQGVPFIVQELLDGKDLGKHVKASGGKLSLRETMRFLGPVIEAVASGHERGVVHRDLKPENVFLADIGGKTVPKLLDFGISQIRPKPGDVKMTQVGTMMGTPQYMSPEQVKGREIDPRTDVWSIGVMLYEVLSGMRPFDEDVPAIYVAICGHDPTPLETCAPDVPAGIADVVSRCMQRDATLRPADARELARALHSAYQAARAAGPASASLPAAAQSGRSGPPALDEPPPKVPSLLPPPTSTPPQKAAAFQPTSPPSAPTSAPARTSMPQLTVNVPSDFDDDDDDAVAPRRSGLTLDAPVSSERPRAVSSYTVAPREPHPVPEGESAAPYLAGGMLALGLGVGLVGSLFGYDAAHAEAFVAGLPDGARMAVGALLFGLGVFVGFRTFRAARDAPDERGMAIGGGVLVGVVVFVGLKLLTA